MSKTIIEKVGGKIYIKNKIYKINGEKYKGAMFIIELNIA